MPSAVCLTMRRATLDDLRARADALIGQVRPDGRQLAAAGAGACKVACRNAEPTDEGAWRVRLEPDALDFVATQAPDLAEKWPSVFEGMDSAELEGRTLGQVVALVSGHSRGSARLEADVAWDGAVLEARVILEGGDAIVFRSPAVGDGIDRGIMVEYRDRPERPSEKAMRLSEPRR